jgi:hypothetical protein
MLIKATIHTLIISNIKSKSHEFGMYLSKINLNAWEYYEVRKRDAIF